MKIAPSLLLTLLSLGTSAVCTAQTQTVDFPAGADWPTITRPPGSIIAAASHTDYDEFQVPMAATNGGQFLKVQPARGAIDYLAYSGSPSVSTLQNQERITAQLLSEGYKPLFHCERKACNGYDFGMALARPLINTLDGTGYHNFTVETFGAVTDDVRYTAFQKGDEYLCLLTALAPGKYSGVLLIDVGGKNPVAAKTAATSTQPAATSNSTAADAASTAQGRLRGRLKSLLNK